MFCGIPSTRLEAVWRGVSPWIEAAVVRGYQKDSAEDIRKALESRDLQLWLDVEKDVRGVVVSEIVSHPQRKTCRLRIVTGYNRGEWQGNLKTIEEWAKSQGCDSMELIARPGWKRVLKDYEMTHLILEKEL